MSFLSHKIQAGQRFGKITVSAAGQKIDRRFRVACRCDCGTEKTFLAYNLLSGNSRSCGCERGRQPKARKRAEYTLNKDPIYKVWHAMKGRCHNPNDYSFGRYGARGIGVCPEWRGSFQLFRAWAIKNGYARGLTIERKDNGAGYSPANCRWASLKEQARNRRNNKLVLAFGEEKTAVEWAEDSRCFVSAKSLCQRIRRGWPPERSLLR